MYTGAFWFMVCIWEIPYLLPSFSYPFPSFHSQALFRKQKLEKCKFCYKMKSDSCIRYFFSIPITSVPLYLIKIVLINSFKKACVNLYPSRTFFICIKCFFYNIYFATLSFNFYKYVYLMSCLFVFSSNF